MPYDSVDDLPSSVKDNLPKHAQEIYKEAYNHAADEYGDEERAHRTAWSAVKEVYEKKDGEWVKSDS